MLRSDRFFTPSFRDDVERDLLALAEGDPRVVAGALVGSRALGRADRWSDLDLTFGLAEGVSVGEMLDQWAEVIRERFGAVRLFDLPSGSTTYRVFLLPGCLQLDLSFSPAAEFGARGPGFRLLFGEAASHAWPAPPDPGELFGYAVHHAVRARFCIERGKVWQAEYWTSAVRDYALSLACRRRGLPAHYGRGFDNLPAGILEDAKPAIARSLDPTELLRALGAAVRLLQQESAEACDLAAELEADLGLLVRPRIGTEPGT
jgi:hypothetical protein